ncbi:MAG: deoxyribose-phosphate aldolase [Proteobacteria bacterium]|nr:deoxyribose-phosphate aldolase [Pseudomonadota bacterium]
MDLAKYIDHTLLRPEATPAEAEALCREALKYRFKAVCLNPLYVALASGILKGSGVEVATVIGFPLGANTTVIKMSEAKDALANGATEIDMVMAAGLFKAGDDAMVQRDIDGVVRAAEGRTVKVILETCLLDREGIVRACLIALAAGASFVKTSTGFGSRGASIEDVRTMREAVGGKLGIKASGGIRTREQALAMIEAGATRIGTSAGATIVRGK